jgi:hypothetical protein
MTSDGDASKIKTDTLLKPVAPLEMSKFSSGNPKTLDGEASTAKPLAGGKKAAESGLASNIHLAVPGVSRSPSTGSSVSEGKAVLSRWTVVSGNSA